MTDSFQIFSLHLFDSSLQWLLQPGAEAGCCQSQPAGTQQDLGAPASATGGNRIVLPCTLPGASPRTFAWGCTSPLCPRLLTLLHCAGLLLSGMGWVECLLFHFWFPGWSWHEASLKYFSGLTDLPNLQTERGPDTVACHRAPEHFPYTHWQLHSKLNMNSFICCDFFPHISFNYCVVTHGKWKLLYAESSILLSVNLRQLGWLLK